MAGNFGIEKIEFNDTNIIENIFTKISSIQLHDIMVKIFEKIYPYNISVKVYLTEDDLDNDKPAINKNINSVVEYSKYIDGIKELFLPPDAKIKISINSQYNLTGIIYISYSF